MRFRQVGNKYDLACIVIKNNGTAAIPTAAPVFLSINGTDDGIAVLNATDAAAAKQNLFAGVIVSGSSGPGSSLAANGGFGEAQVFGFCQSARLVRMTRAASSDSYASATAIAVGDILQVNTISGVDAFSRNGAGATNTAFPVAVAAQTLASYAGAATTSSDTSLAVTTTIKVFLRAM